MRIIYCRPSMRGWDPITLMAQLAAELLEAELIVVGDGETSMARKLLAYAPRRRGNEACLVIAPHPAHLQKLLRREHWLDGYGFVAGWVIDSFWDDRIPHMARGRGHFDHFFVTDQEMVDSWHTATGTTVSWLPWGTDALRMGTPGNGRPVDLQRFGRQPDQWDDDESNRLACQVAGIRYEGRPPFLSDPQANHKAAMAQIAQAKFTLSFTNRVSPAGYTHPTREYLTGRWTNALAAGAVIAGIPPGCRTARELLWPEAILDLGTVDRAEGIQRLSKAIQAWRPDLAKLNYRRALERLDWRWRFQEVARTIGIEPKNLDSELATLEALVRG